MPRAKGKTHKDNIWLLFTSFSLNHSPLGTLLTFNASKVPMDCESTSVQYICKCNAGFSSASAHGVCMKLFVSCSFVLLAVVCGKTIDGNQFDTRNGHPNQTQIVQISLQPSGADNKGGLIN